MIDIVDGKSLRISDSLDLQAVTAANKMRIGVTGHRGRLGHFLVEKFGFVPLTLDVGNEEAVISYLNEHKMDAVINCAAYTKVDAAEDPENHEQLKNANIRGPFFIRRNFPSLYLIHISTGFVFDGKEGPYLEEATPNPINQYALSKLAGEAAIHPLDGPTLTIRTLDLFGGTSGKRDFVTAMLGILNGDDDYPLPDNLMGNPTYIPSLGDGLMQCIDSQLTGILNLCGSTVLSRFQFGRLIAEVFGYNPDQILPTNEIKGAAARPKNPGLLTLKAEALGINVLSAREGLAHFKQDMERALDDKR